MRRIIKIEYESYISVYHSISVNNIDDFKIRKGWDTVNY